MMLAYLRGPKPLASTSSFFLRRGFLFVFSFLRCIASGLLVEARIKVLPNWREEGHSEVRTCSILGSVFRTPFRRFQTGLSLTSFILLLLRFHVTASFL